MKMYDKKKKAIRICSRFRDFDGDVEKWKISFYELWRLEMTWSFAYRITVEESRASGVFVSLLIREVYKDNLIETMTGLGYGNIISYEEDIGEVDAYEHDELEDIVELVLEY